MPPKPSGRAESAPNTQPPEDNWRNGGARNRPASRACKERRERSTQSRAEAALPHPRAVRNGGRAGQTTAPRAKDTPIAPEKSAPETKATGAEKIRELLPPRRAPRPSTASEPTPPRESARTARTAAQGRAPKSRRTTACRTIRTPSTAVIRAKKSGKPTAECRSARSHAATARRLRLLTDPTAADSGASRARDNSPTFGSSAPSANSVRTCSTPIPDRADSGRNGTRDSTVSALAEGIRSNSSQKFRIRTVGTDGNSARFISHNSGYCAAKQVASQTASTRSGGFACKKPTVTRSSSDCGATARSPGRSVRSQSLPATRAVSASTVTPARFPTLTCFPVKSRNSELFPQFGAPTRTACLISDPPPKTLPLRICRTDTKNSPRAQNCQTAKLPNCHAATLQRVVNRNPHFFDFFISECSDVQIFLQSRDFFQKRY